MADHEHNHAHGHDHGGQQAYLADQLCTIAITAAYAGIMGFLFYTHWKSGGASRSLLTLVVPWIQLLVVGGSILLFALAVIRAIGVWWAAGQPEAHGHDHDHDHGDDHGHSHGWSPLRYVPLVLPLVLYFIGMPNADMIKRFEQDLVNRGKPAAHVGTSAANMTELPSVLAALASSQLLLPDGGASFAVLQVATVTGAGTAADYFEEEATNAVAQSADVGLLEELAKETDPERQQHWRQYSRVETEGFFDPASPDGKFFRIVRLRMACCLNDAQPSFVLAVSRRPRPVKELQSNWVVVQGRIDFIRRDGKAYPLMKVYSIEPKPRPGNIYLK